MTEQGDKEMASPSARRASRKSFLICPVRGKDPAAYAGIVSSLESEGFAVHWPPRDTDQNDGTGLRICSDNAAAIAAADVVHIVWDGQSQGCLFDLGVAFALKKPVIPIVLPLPSEGKSFQNMIRAWADARSTNPT
jgi:nucleoside 2-deoxyribosyltransferase